MEEKEMLQVFSNLSEEILNEKITIEASNILRNEQVNVDEKAIGFSSLELVEFIIRVEEYYKISITEEEIAKFKLVKDLMVFIQEESIKQKQRNIAIEEATAELFS